MGFVYPILFRFSEYHSAIAKLKANHYLEEPSYEYHYTTLGGRIRIRAAYELVGIEKVKWYTGKRRWGDTRKYGERWAVFKCDKDRTLALMILQ